MSDNSEQFIADALPAILEVLQGTDIRELDVEEGSVRIRVHRMPRQDSVKIPSASDEPYDNETGRLLPCLITSPLVGTFYRAGQPGTPPLVSEGSHVDEETVVGIVESLHVLTDIEAGCSGVVTKVHATDGQPVEYGQALFEVTPVG